MTGQIMIHKRAAYADASMQIDDWNLIGRALDL